MGLFTLDVNLSVGYVYSEFLLYIVDYSFVYVPWFWPEWFQCIEKGRPVLDPWFFHMKQLGEKNLIANGIP